MDEYLIGNGTVITLGPQNRIIPDGAVLVRGASIAAIGPTTELRQQYQAPLTIDARNKIILPGFICAHHHLYSTMARGFAPPGEPALTFAEILERLWWKLDQALTKEDVYYSALIPLCECIRNGTTTILDHHASPSCRQESLGVIADAVLQSGLRASLCYEVSDRNLPGAGVEANAAFLQRVAQERSPFLTGMVGIHASFTVSDETLQRCRELGEQFGVGYHIHVAEGPEDGADALARYGLSTVQRLIQREICGDRSLFIHCIHISEEDITAIQRSGTMVVHNPESNMNNAVGVAPVLKLLQQGVLVGLGTDGMSSDMPAQMRCAYLLQRLAQHDPRVAFVEAPQLLLWNNAQIAQRLFSLPLGQIAVGAPADLAILDYCPPTDLKADNFLGHFIFGMVDATVDTTVCGGRVLMQDKHLLVLDEEQITARSRQLAQALWQRIV